MQRYPPLFRLYLIVLDGCESCDVVKPRVRTWIRTRPWLKYREVDITQVEWRAVRWTPTVVPTLVVVTPDGAVYRRTEHPTSQLDAAGLEDFLRRVAPAALVAP